MALTIAKGVPFFRLHGFQGKISRKKDPNAENKLFLLGYF